MVVSVLLQFLLFVTELLAVVNIDTGGPIPWSAVFSPLYLLVFASIPTCLWNCYRKRGVEVRVRSHDNFLNCFYIMVIMFIFLYRLSSLLLPVLFNLFFLV